MFIAYFKHTVICLIYICCLFYYFKYSSLSVSKMVQKNNNKIFNY